MSAGQADQPATGPAHLSARSLLPAWSAAAAVRAARATVVMPVMLWLSFDVIGNIQVALFAVFGSFAALVMTTFVGTRRDRARAHLGLALVGTAGVVLGTVASGSAWLAALVTLVVAFAIYFGGVVGPYAAAGVTGALLAYVIAVASTGGVAAIPPRLGGWWLASVVSTAVALLVPAPSPGARLRQSAAALARAIARQLQAAVDGTAGPADREATMAAKRELILRYDATPYRPTGLAAADQALVSLISLLEWCTALTCEATDGHLDLGGPAGPDRDLLAEAAATLAVCADLLDGGEELPSLERIWRARLASATHLRGLTGEPATVRVEAERAFHAQAIGVAAAAAAADSMIASGRVDPGSVAADRQRWLGGHPESATAADDRSGRRWHDLMRLPLPRPGSAIAADASIRSVWFRNSARGAVAIAAAVAIAKLFDVVHAFWVVLGTLSVLRTSAGATGATALRALGGTVAGFAVGAALLVGIGTSMPALWTALVIAVLVAAYAPGTAPFVVGQAAFTVTVVVLFNLLAPAGWRIGLVRVEDVAIGCAVSVVVGALFWPRGASALVGDNLADAFRAGAANLADATAWVLGGPKRSEGLMAAAAAASIRLDDAVRGYLTEQGSKRLAREDLRQLTMSALRLRLTAHSLASLPGLGAARGPAAQHPVGARVRDELTGQSARLAAFYGAIAAEVSRPFPARNGPDPVAAPADEPLPASAGACAVGGPHYHPEALWVRDHLRQLGSHSAEVIGPAGRLAAVRRRPWWR
jgi:uncharacterized membrane protein YccC